MDRKFWVICIAVLVFIGLCWTRYQVIQLSGVGGFYKINHSRPNDTGRGDVYAARAGSCRDEGGDTESAREQTGRTAGRRAAVKLPQNAK